MSEEQEATTPSWDVWELVVELMPPGLSAEARAAMLSGEAFDGAGDMMKFADGDQATRILVVAKWCYLAAGASRLALNRAADMKATRARLICKIVQRPGTRPPELLVNAEVERQDEWLDASWRLSEAEAAARLAGDMREAIKVALATPVISAPDEGGGGIAMAVLEYLERHNPVSG